MAEDTRDLLIVGLRNAHAMENQAEELIERQIERTDKYPDVQQRLKQHLLETREQKRRLRRALKQLDASTSTTKDLVLSLGASLAAFGHAVAGDEILKNTFANNAFENYEIAAYKSLIALCQEAGVRGFMTELRQSLEEEERMAKWVDSNVENVTLQYLNIEAREKEKA